MDLTQFSHWVINTNSLLKPTQVIANPSPFTHMSPLKESNYNGNHRLGFVYQHICSELFQSSQHHELLAEEIQINDNKRTLGAIDFIINDPFSGYQHWEVAIKFYLFHNGYWYGPNAHDRLDKKLNHMLKHQLSMSQNPSFVQQYPNWHPIMPKVLLQGRLYINPFLDQTIPTKCLDYELESSQINGFWCYQSQLELVESPLFKLEKPYWATGHSIHQELYRPVSGQFEHCQDSRGRFWFVVPEQWPDNQ
ncbi:DUF1853 family protein [Vibrio sp. WJH972]